MEKAILKTLIYADIFDYPLKIWEIHKWLIGRKTTLFQIERSLERLSKKKKVKAKLDCYFLPRRDGLVRKRQNKGKQSAKYLRKAKVLTFILKLVPWIKLVGISGGLAMENASKQDDIDLFIIAGKNRLWISRFLTIILLSLTGQRRKVSDVGRKITGKLCINTLLEEDRLEQTSKDMYLAHEVLQMKVLWQRDGIYSKYLADNEWVFNFLPNWIANTRLNNIHQSSIVNHKSILDQIEKLAKWYQLKTMGKPKGMERIEDGALYFHPHDCRQKVLAQYHNTTQKLSVLDK